MVGWGVVAGGEGWLGKGGPLEYHRGTNQGGGGAWLTGSCVPQTGMAPLHYAAENGHEAVAGALLEAGANTGVKDEVSGGGGWLKTLQPNSQILTRSSPMAESYPLSTQNPRYPDVPTLHCNTLHRATINLRNPELSTLKPYRPKSCTLEPKHAAPHSAMS